MPHGLIPILTGAVEGDLGEAVIRRIVEYAGLSLGTVYGRKGKPFLLDSLNGYNKAAQFSPWVTVVDLDRDCDCAPTCFQKWLPNPSAEMCFRIAVRAVEAWLLADRERIARWLRVTLTRVLQNPDALVNPKQELVNLARRSRVRSIQNDLVPRYGSGRTVGPLYATSLIAFLNHTSFGWRPEHAVAVSDSLARCVRALRRFGQ